MGISTHTNKLASRFKKITTGLVKIGRKKRIQGAKEIIIDSIEDRAEETKKSAQSLRRKLVNLFKRPLNDISHLSIILVIALALFSGLSALTVSNQQVNVNPFVLSKTTDNKLAPKADKVIAEANSVATVASIYSDNMGVDAAQVTDSLYQKTSMVSTTTTYLASVPVVAPASDTSSTNKATNYTVLDGDTLSSIAVKFNVSTDTIRYANGITDVDSIRPGQTLVIPPVNGILYTIKNGDTTASIAAKFNVAEALIISQNSLYGEDLVPGSQIMIPDAEIPDIPKPQVQASTNSTRSSSPGISYVATTTGPNHFPWGWCTWWVANKRYVPWSGNAKDWYWNAQAYGRPEGRTPVPGAIMVTWESGYGHVAYVESVSGGSFTVSEMNYRGYGIVSTRTITTSQVPLIGFIY